MKRNNLIEKSLAAMLLAFVAILSPLAVMAEKANVFFIHGANVSEQDARAAKTAFGYEIDGSAMVVIILGWRS